MVAWCGQVLTRSSPVAEFLKTRYRCLTTAVRSAPVYAAVRAVGAVVSAFIPIGFALPMQFLIDRLAAGASGMTDLLGPAVIMVAAGIAGAILPRTMTFLDGEITRRSSLVCQSHLYRAVDRQVGVSAFEDPVLQNQLHSARTLGVGAAGACMAAYLESLQATIVLMTFVVALAKSDAIIPLLVLLAGGAPAVALELSMSRLRVAGQLALSESHRREMFFATLLSNPRVARETRLFGIGHYLTSLMRVETRHIYATRRSVDISILRRTSVLQLLGGVASGAIVAWALVQVVSGGMTIGSFALAVAAIAATQGALAALIGALAAGNDGIRYYRILRAVIDKPSDLRVAVTPNYAPLLENALEFHDVWFRYNEEQEWVLKGVSLRVPADGLLFIVGLNGAGKSSIVNLLCRFYDPTFGSITWDGTDLRALDPVSLRRRIGAILQQPTSYDLTVAENIGLGDVSRFEAGQADLCSAARDGGALQFIQQLPDGLRTMLGSVMPTGRSIDGVTRLSGGQWQRLGIARGLLRASVDLLILDEFSSGLDPQMETQVHRTVRDRRCARVIVSHRLGYVEGDDLVLVLDDGKVVESGSHVSLLAQDGIYARLFNSQASGYSHNG